MPEFSDLGTGCFQMAREREHSPLGIQNKTVVSSLNLDPPEVNVEGPDSHSWKEPLGFFHFNFQLKNGVQCWLLVTAGYFLNTNKLLIWTFSSYFLILFLSSLFYWLDYHAIECAHTMWVWRWVGVQTCSCHCPQELTVKQGT